MIILNPCRKCIVQACCTTVCDDYSKWMITVEGFKEILEASIRKCVRGVMILFYTLVCTAALVFAILTIVAFLGSVSIR